ncbi:MAG: adenosylcobinamide-phosphate synthase CbiB [Candidatus Rokuibacteriota bacterium]
MTSEVLWGPAVMVLAVALDQLVADPPNRWHPVAWIGGLLGWGRARLQYGSPRGLLLRGTVLVMTVAALAWGSAWMFSVGARGLGWPGVVLEALALKMLISLRGLTDACDVVAEALRTGSLDRARELLGYHLVSRATASLDEGQVASAIVESAAENLTDAFVAPLCFYVVFGLGGACVYRAINTADAMFGYRGGPLEFFGKASARLDDLLNLIPARLAALALVMAAALAGGRGWDAWSTMVRDHERTASPNAGWTMATMAGALGVVLEKVGAYRLGRGSLPRVEHVYRSLRLVRVGALGTVLMLLGAFLLRNYSR